MNWYAVTVKPQHEKAVKAQLEAASIEVFLPLYLSRRNWSDRIKTIQLPVFRGYVFSHLDVDSRRHVLNIPSVTSIVGFGGKPMPLAVEEIDAIKTMTGSGLPVEPWPLLRAGQKVRICSGPLIGLKGILTEAKSGFRVVVNVELLNRAVSVEIDRDCVELLSYAHSA